MKHKHHIIPKHMNGSDEPENLITLTIEEHAEAHRILWETHKKLQDFVAWKMLSGKTEEGEAARILLAKEGFKQFIKTEAYEQCKKKISITLTGKKQSSETNKKRSLSLKKAYKEGRHQNFFENLPIEYRKKLWKENREALAHGRRNSIKWKVAVTSQKRKLEGRINSPKAKKLLIDGVLYFSIREAAEKTEFSYFKLLRFSNGIETNDRVIFI